MEPRHRAAQGHNGLCGAKRRAAPAKMRKADSKLVSTPEENAGVSARTALREAVRACTELRRVRMLLSMHETVNVKFDVDGVV